MEMHEWVSFSLGRGGPGGRLIGRVLLFFLAEGRLGSWVPGDEASLGPMGDETSISIGFFCEECRIFENGPKT